jgi:transcriptional regulator with XRE-family HTH domain
VDKIISEHIRKQSAFTGLSQENVAEELGMSTENYGKLERGEITISVNHLYAKAKVFKIHPADFFLDSPRAQEAQAAYNPLKDVFALLQTVGTLEREKSRVKTNVRKLMARNGEVFFSF